MCVLVNWLGKVFLCRHFMCVQKASCQSYQLRPCELEKGKGGLYIDVLQTLVFYDKFPSRAAADVTGRMASAQKCCRQAAYGLLEASARVAGY
jgi:hypothetical protein